MSTLKCDEVSVLRYVMTHGPVDEKSFVEFSHVNIWEVMRVLEALKDRGIVHKTADGKFFFADFF